MKKVVLILSIVLLISLTIINFVLFRDQITYSLKGEEIIELEVNSLYQEQGIIIKNHNKELSKDKYSLKITNNIDNQVLGTYLVKYEIIYKRKKYTLERTIKVIDKTKPIIEVNTKTVTKDYCTKKIKTKLEFTAKDNYDGDLTKSIERIENDDIIILKVKDTSQNETIEEIKIEFTNKPKNKFSLVGSSKVKIPLNGSYKESGAKYTDGCGNKIDKEIKISGKVDTTKLGEYKISYEVDNNKLTRKVTVYDPAKEENTNGKIIYLTFDDGPGYYTNKVLNTLDKYNIKATFFVTHQFPAYESLIKTEYNKGHKIAVHTYTHNYKTVYSSVDNYINDFNKMNEVIKNNTGSYSKLFRFPGGSSNTVSKNYSKGVVTNIAKKNE